MCLCVYNAFHVFGWMLSGWNTNDFITLCSSIESLLYHVVIWASTCLCTTKYWCVCVYTPIHMLNVHSLKHPLIWSTLFLGNGSCLCVNNSNYHAYYIWSLILSPDSRVSIRVHNPFHMSNPNIEISLTPCAMWS